MRSSSITVYAVTCTEKKKWRLKFHFPQRRGFDLYVKIHQCVLPLETIFWPISQIKVGAPSMRLYHLRLILSLFQIKVKAPSMRFYHFRLILSLFQIKVKAPSIRFYHLRLVLSPFLLEGATSRFVRLESFGLNFSNFSFVIWPF